MKERLSTITISRAALPAILIGMLALGLRLWGLGQRVMSHDESLHVYYSWLLATGKGYSHNPMMHGPSLFEITALLDWVFGASDFTARLGPALIGSLVAAAVPQFLRRWLGNAGALAASLLLAISPFVLYFSRYIRHDILAIAFMLVAVIAVFHYLENRQDHYLYLLAASLALMLSTMEISFFYMAVLASFLVLRALYRYGWRLELLRLSAEIDLAVVIVTLGAFFSSPIALLVMNPVWRRVSGAPFVDLKLLDSQSLSWSTGIAGLRLWGLLVLFGLGALIIGLVWDRRRWPGLAITFFLIAAPLYTTFFTNRPGLGTGLVGSLGYWLSQQGVARGGQPFYYYLLVFPLYEYLPFLGGLLASVYYLRNWRVLAQGERLFVAFLLWWAGLILLGLSLAGEKMPWLSTHIAIPFILLAGWWIGQLIEGGWQPEGNRRGRAPSVVGRIMILYFLGALALLTLRTSIAANFINYDYTTEYIDYAHGAPGVKWALDDIAAIGQQTGQGKNLKVAYDDDVAWPMTWYLRDYPNQTFYGSQPTREALDAAVVLAGPKDWDKVEAILGGGYRRYEVIRLWWPIEDYKELTAERLRFALSNPAMRSALWAILWDRDYRPYAAATGQDLNPPTTWPLSERMRIYIKSDIAAAQTALNLSNSILPIPTPTVDLYLNLHKNVPAEKLLLPGLTAPRAVALAPDGSLYVADSGAGRILHLDAQGKQLAAWGSHTPEGQTPPMPGTFNEPWGLAVDAQGNVFVADTWNHRIQKFNANGEFLLQWGTPGQASDGPGRFWGPRGLAISRDGRIYVTDTGNRRVMVFDEQGKALQEFGAVGDPGLNEPVGTALDQEGHIYIADTWNHRVAVYNSDTTFIKSFPYSGWTGESVNNKPYLAVDNQGRIYLTDPEAARVVVFSNDGQPLLEFGQAGPETNDLGQPVGIALSADGKVLLADAGNNRIGIYRPFP